MTTKEPAWRCGVCGESASLMTASRTGTKYRCYEHEYDDAPDTQEGE